MQTFFRECVYGRFCGVGCSGTAFSTSNYELHSDSPEDKLDQACYFHDKCFEKGTECEQCLCNKNLADLGEQVFKARIILGVTYVAQSK